MKHSPTKAAKVELRRHMRSERERLAPEDHTTCSLRAQERFISLARFEASECVALYSPAHGEIRTDLLFETARNNGKAIVFPKMLDQDPTGMAFYPVEDLAELEPGRFGISEPSGTGAPVPPDQIDLMAVPGVAFDAHGNRLGYGGGYFDRLLGDTHRRPRWATGIAFHFQIVPEVPRDPRDEAVDQVVTESHVFSRMRN